MKRVVTSLVATVAGVAVLLGFKTHPPKVTTVNTAATLDTTTTAPIAGGTQAPRGATTSTTPGATRTITGAAENTRYGPVQVQITLNGSQITSVDVVEYPQSRSRDIEINSYAVPALVNQALEAQSSNIDGVSGATYTTDGFVASLQSALSKS